MAARVQISAVVSSDTKMQLEQYAEAHGIKKGHLIEEALLFHLRALQELPDDAVIPPRIVVSEASGAEILDLIENPRPPTPAMRELFDG